LINSFDAPPAGFWGLPMVELVVADFLDFAFLGVVIVAIAVAILIIRINKQ
jgi:hypothetical protein